MARSKNQDLDVVEFLLSGSAPAPVQVAAAQEIERLRESEARAWRDFLDTKARLDAFAQ